MLIPKNWLNDFVDLTGLSDEEITKSLFSCGFEVEEVIKKNNDVKNIVTCQILEKERHPDAEKLFVCQVDAGSFGKLQIVTNATNVQVGDIVPVALVGAVLADGTPIKKGKLRGVESDGMFCGGEEIGITEEFYDGAGNDSVLIFHDKFDLGADVCELMQAKETIFDISVTANRPDCQSIIGIAREVSSLFGRPLIMPETNYSVSDVDVNDKISVNVLDSDLCSRYMASFVYDVKLAPSPKWMQRRLALLGIRAINNVVDITNYVLNEIGQPMHAFDYRELNGHKIVVRRAKDGEKIKTLDEKEFTLTNSNLVICDAEKPSALAGIMGGLGSGIKDDTEVVVFESARFKRDNIRKTSKTLGQRSDSSARYEKGVDAATTELGLSRALALIDMLSVGKIAKNHIDINTVDMNRRVINCKLSQINKLLGIEVPANVASRILNSLEFDCKINGDEMSVSVPLYREDVEGFPDLAEEIIRMYGYDKIDCKLLDNSKITVGGRTSEQNYELRVKNYLAESGFNEIITYSFISPKDYENFGFNLEDEKVIKLFNPLGEDISLMRTTLIPSMVNAVSKNLNKKNLEGRLFELAKVYLPKSLPLEELPTERLMLSLSVFGSEEDFFTLKGEVEGILDSARFNEKVKFVACDKKFMHPTKSAFVVTESGKTLGFFGELHPLVAEKLDVNSRIYVGELDFSLMSEQFGNSICFENYSKYPSMERDLALVCDLDSTNESVVEIIKSANVKMLNEIKLFDVYTGERIEQGKKSLAYRLTFSCLERTLGMDEVDGFVKKILKKLNEKGITLR